MKRCAVIHTTVYDGTLERACLKLSVPCFSVTDSNVNQAYAVTTTANMLLEDDGRKLFSFFLQTGFRLTSFNYQNKC